MTSAAATAASVENVFYLQLKCIFWGKLYSPSFCPEGGAVVKRIFCLHFCKNNLYE